MTSVKELNNITAIVTDILTKHPETRNSDNILYYYVLKRIAQNNGCNIDGMSVMQFLLNMRKLQFPPFESVRRARQKTQRKHPELAGNSRTEAHRAINEGVYRDYARKV